MLHKLHVSHIFTSIKSIELTGDAVCPATHHIPPHIISCLCMQGAVSGFYALLAYSASASQVSGLEEVEMRLGFLHRADRWMFYGSLVEHSPSFKAMRCENLPKPTRARALKSFNWWALSSYTNLY